jgi:hypothetical protein
MVEYRGDSFIEHSKVPTAFSVIVAYRQEGQKRRKSAAT